jgi:hypothetical protein
VIGSLGLAARSAVPSHAEPPLLFLQASLAQSPTASDWPPDPSTTAVPVLDEMIELLTPVRAEADPSEAIVEQEPVRETVREIIREPRPKALRPQHARRIPVAGEDRGTYRYRVYWVERERGAGDEPPARVRVFGPTDVW